MECKVDSVPLEEECLEFRAATPKGDVAPDLQALEVSQEEEASVSTDSDDQEVCEFTGDGDLPSAAAVIPDLRERSEDGQEERFVTTPRRQHPESVDEAGTLDEDEVRSIGERGVVAGACGMGSPGEDLPLREESPMKEFWSDDLRILAAQRQSSGWSTSTCQEVSKDVLKARAKLHMRREACTVRTLHGQEADYEFRSVCGTSVDVLGEYGVGVPLYFHFLWQMGLTFCLMVVITSPLLVFNVLGNMVIETSVVYEFMGTMTIANLGFCPDDGCRTADSRWDRRACRSCGFKLREATEWLGWLDGIAILLFMLCVTFFSRRWIPRIVKRNGAKHTTIADYSVEITVLPKWLEHNHEMYQDELRRHFEDALAALGVDDPRPVHKVSLVRDYQGAINKFMKKGRLLQELQCAELRLVQKERAGKEKGARKYEKRIKAHTLKISRIRRRLKKQAEISDKQRGVCMAFVTFTKEEYKRKVLNEYRFSQYSLFLLCQPRRLRFCDRRICVAPASEPSDLCWENLDYSRARRAFRKVAVMLLTIIILVVCSTLLVFFSSFHATATAAVQPSSVWVLGSSPGSGAGCLRLCSWKLFGGRDCHEDGDTSALWHVEKVFDSEREVNLNGTLQWEPNCESAWESPACTSSVAGDWIGVQFRGSHTTRCMQVEQPLNASVGAASALQLYACQDPPLMSNGTWRPEDHCTLMEVMHPSSIANTAEPTLHSGSMPVIPDTSCSAAISLEVAQTLKLSGVSPTEDPVITCFCRQQYKLHGVTLRIPPYQSPEAVVCKEFSQELNLRQAQLAGSIIAVLVINQFLLMVYDYLIGWERSRTRSDAIRSQLWKLFLAQFVNTGLLALLINAHLKSTPEWLFLFKTFSIGEGRHDDISPAWLVSVGAGVVLTVFMEIFSTTVPPLLRSFILFPLQMWYYGRRKATQETLDAIYVLPDWNISLRLAQSLNIFFCVLLYSGGMPIMYLVGTAYCFVAYWLDKWCLLRGSSKPPAYKHDVIRVCAEALPIGAFCHVALTLWTFGKQQLFPGPWSAVTPLAELLFGVSRDEYSAIMALYTTGTEEDRAQQQDDFVHARLLDCSRKGNLLLLGMFLLLTACACVSWLWRWLLEPVLSPWVFLARDTCGRRGLALQTAESKDSPSIEQAMEDMDRRGAIRSYEISANPKYQAAYLAICYAATESTERSAGREAESNAV